MRKWVLLVVVLVVGAVVFFAAWLRLPTMAALGPGYSAEISCACVFISGRTLESCRGDLDRLARTFVSVSVAPERRSVTAHTLGLVRRTARYHDGYGCVLED